MTPGPYAVSSTPTRDEVLTLADGRRVAVARWGEDPGRPVPWHLDPSRGVKGR